MAEEKNIYLIRLNKLYHFLNDHNARVTIDNSENSNSNKTIFKAQNEEFNLKDLFYQGCELKSLRALKEITGNRSFTESKSIGRYSNIQDNQKDIIKSVQYNFKKDVLEDSALRVVSESKKDLFLKKNFTNYNIGNIKSVYKSFSLDIKNSVVELVKNGLKKQRYHDGSIHQGLFKPTWDFGPLNGFFRTYAKGGLVSKEVKNELEIIINHWQKSFDQQGVIREKDVLPGISSLSLPFNKTEYSKLKLYSSLSLSEINERLAKPYIWPSIQRYYLTYKLQELLSEEEDIHIPEHVQALVLLMGAEYSAIKTWIYQTTLNEVNNNVEFSVRYSSHYGKAEYVLDKNLSVEELSILLEDYNFEEDPVQFFRIKNNNIVDTPLYIYGSSIETDFLYDRTTFQYALKLNLFKHFYSELKKHLGFYDNEETKALKEQSDIIRNEIANQERP